MSTTPIPSINVLPPMSPAVRRFLYGTLAWLAFLSALATGVIAVVPAWHLPDWFFATSAGVNLAWTFLGFKAQGAVTDIKA